MDIFNCFFIDLEEVEKFFCIVVEWWDLDSKFKFLYKFNFVCFDFIWEIVGLYFNCIGDKFFEGLCILDIGCGGGLVFEFMVCLGVDMVLVDVLEVNIKMVSVYV